MDTEEEEDDDDDDDVVDILIPGSLAATHRREVDPASQLVPRLCIVVRAIYMQEKLGKERGEGRAMLGIYIH